MQLKYLLVLVGLVILNYNLLAQNLTFEEEPLSKVFQKIEKQSNWTFNFDAKSVANYTYTGKLNLEEGTDCLTQLLYETPYEFEIEKETVLIVLPPPKKYQIKGYLQSASDNSPLPYANIYAEGQRLGTQSDENGYFELEIEAHKNQVIHFRYLGYKDQSFMVQEWGAGTSQNVQMTLSENLLDINLVITDYLMRGIVEGEDYGSIHLDYKTLSKNNRNLEDDILKMVQHLPGITSVDESATRLNIRGSSPDQNLILWENATLYGPGHLFGMISAINPYVVNKVKVHKAAYNPQYGSTIGGIVDINLDDEVSNTFKGGIGVNTIQAHTYLNVPIVKNKLSLLVSGRNSINRVTSTPTQTNYLDRIFQTARIDTESGEIEEGERSADSNHNFYDLNAKLIFKPNPNIFIKSAFLKTHNYFLYNSILQSEDIETFDEISFDSYAFSSEANFRWNPSNNLKLHYVLSSYKNEHDSSYDETDELGINEYLYTYNDIKDQQIGVNNEWQLNKELSANLGYVYEQKEVNSIIDETLLYGEGFNDNDQNTGHFHNLTTSATWNKEKFIVQAGLRNTYYNELGKWFLAPRMSLQYSFLKDLKFKFSAGSYYQFISQYADIDDQGLNAGNNVWELSFEEGDEVLNSKKIAAGLVFKKNNWLIDVEAYIHQNEGLSSLANTRLVGVDNEIEGEASVQGIDFLINKNWTHYKFWVNYTLSQNLFYFEDLEEEGFPASNDHRHNLSIVNKFVWGKWQAAITYQFRNGLPFSQPTSIVEYTAIEYEDGEEEEETYYTLDYSEINNNLLGNYARLDLGISYKTPIFKNKINLECDFSLLNVLNRENIESKHFFLNEIESEEEEEEEEGIEQFQITGLDKLLLRRTPKLSIRWYW